MGSVVGTGVWGETTSVDDWFRNLGCEGKDRDTAGRDAGFRFVCSLLEGERDLNITKYESGVREGADRARET